jgi:hypothetical protein
LISHGVNQIIWHGTPFNKIGSDSVSFYATVHVGKAGTLSKHLLSFNNYLSTVSDYMRKGDVYSDVAVYLPLEDSWIAGAMPVEKQLPWAWGEYEFRYEVVPEEVRGFQPLWVNGDFLEEGRRLANQGSRLKAEGKSKVLRQMAEGKSREEGSGEGISLKVGSCNFKSLYVDAKYLDYKTLQTMVGLAEGGFPICLKQKPEEAGYLKHVDFDKSAARLVELTKSNWSDLPVNKPLVEGDDLPYFWCRKDHDKYYIFFAHPVAKEFKYPVKYGQADTNETISKSITINIEGKSVMVNLVFKPYESILLEIGSDGKYRLISLPEIN